MHVAKFVVTNNPEEKQKEVPHKKNYFLLTLYFLCPATNHDHTFHNSSVCLVYYLKNIYPNKALKDLFVSRFKSFIRVT